MYRLWAYFSTTGWLDDPFCLWPFRCNSIPPVKPEANLFLVHAVLVYHKRLGGDCVSSCKIFMSIKHSLNFCICSKTLNQVDCSQSQTFCNSWCISEDTWTYYGILCMKELNLGQAIIPRLQTEHAPRFEENVILFTCRTLIYLGSMLLSRICFCQSVRNAG